MTPTTPVLHRDGTVTFWSVYSQRWIRRTTVVSDREYAAMGDTDRHRITAHLGR